METGEKCYVSGDKEKGIYSMIRAEKVEENGEEIKLAGARAIIVTGSKRPIEKITVEHGTFVIKKDNVFLIDKGWMRMVTKGVVNFAKYELSF